MAESGAMRILLTDDHALVRQGLRHLLESLDRELVVDEAASLQDMLNCIRKQTYDLILLDLMLPDGNAIEVLPELRAQANTTPVIVISAVDAPDAIADAVRAGADGYVLKSSPFEQQRQALELTLETGFYVPLPATALRHLVFDNGRPPELQDEPRLQTLSARESEVLKLLAEGFSNKEISRELNMYENTVKVHVRSILRKLDVRNRTQAALLVQNSRIGQ